MWKPTFEKMTNMQLMWLCICSRRRFENHNGKNSHICNYCDFSSVQAGDLRARVKTHNRRNDKYATNVRAHVKIHIWENDTHATNVTLHLLKQAIWNLNGEILHICNYCNFASVQAGDLRAHVKTHNRRNDKYATNVTLHLFKQAMWGDMWKQTFQKIAHMQLMWLCICSNRRFENHN